MQIRLVVLPHEVQELKQSLDVVVDEVEDVVHVRLLQLYQQVLVGDRSATDLLDCVDGFFNRLLVRLEQFLQFVVDVAWNDLVGERLGAVFDELKLVGVHLSAELADGRLQYLGEDPKRSTF